VGAWWWNSLPPVPADAGTPAAALPSVPAVVPAPPVPQPVASAAVAGAPDTASGVAADRFRLVGMARSGNVGIALIELDGQPARNFRVGDVVDGNLVLREVTAQGAVIGPKEGGATVTLENKPTLPIAGTAQAPADDEMPVRNLSDGSVQADRALRKLGAKHLPVDRPAQAEQANGAQDEAVPDPGQWRPPGQR
jgi:general secretion pathway protein C